ncbi:MAG: hypothetical protein ACI8PZ_000804 [Myxococcota bacterium]|jgi:hypothetical protein
MIPYFRDLGDHIAARWRDRGLVPAALPEVAAAALRERPAQEHTSLAAVLDAVALGTEPAFVRQRDPSAAFGEPPITVYQGTGFCIEVNLWVNGTTLIHGHGFSAAFQVLHGSSLESRYTFQPRAAVGAHLRLGDLVLDRIAPLGVGDVREIPSGDAGIHALFHLDCPSATAVVRTHGDPGALPQWNFHQPGVAFDAAWPDALTPLERRQLQLVQSLLQFEGDAVRVRSILQQARPAFAYPLIGEVMAPVLLQPGTSLGAMEQALDRWYGWVDCPERDTLHAAAARRLYTRAGLRLREVLTDPDDRRVAGLLLTAPDRAAVERYAEAHLEQTATDLLTGFLDRVGSMPNAFHPTANVLGLDAAGTALLRDRIGGASAPLDGRGELDRQLTTMSVFASWFR